MKIFYSPQFLREYERLPEGIKKKAEKKERIFRKSPFNQTLKTHKLKGKLDGFLAFSIDYNYRIVFKLHDSQAVRFHAIGDHSLYDKL